MRVLVRRPGDRLRPDRRQIHAAVLAVLGRFDQHPAIAGHLPVFAKLVDAGEHPVGSFRGLDGQNVPARNHRGLADIEGADRLE